MQTTINTHIIIQCDNMETDNKSKLHNSLNGHNLISLKYPKDLIISYCLREIMTYSLKTLTTC